MPYNDRKKIIYRSLMSCSESPIDERYRLMLLEHYFEGAIEASLPNGGRKWQFVCPFCGPLASKDYKKRQKKAALLWNAVQNSWVFTCAKKGSVDCMKGKEPRSFITNLKPTLGRACKKDR